MKKSIILFFLCVSAFFLFALLSFSSQAADIFYESEPNDTSSTADWTSDDFNNLGAISTASDVDWWVTEFAVEGMANFYVGSIPAECNYDLYLYDATGTQLLASSKNTGSKNELISYHVLPDVQYRMKIVSVSGYSSLYYLFRVKNYECPPAYRYKLSWNIENIHYYVASSAEKYSYAISNAANNWVYTGYGSNKLYPNTRTYTKSQSAIDIYAEYDENSRNNGETIHYARRNGTTGEAYEARPNFQDWLFNEVHLNSYYLDSGSVSVQGVVAHEMGHCFGFKENNTDKQSIMCQYSEGRAVTTVQKVDHIAFNNKY